MYQSYSLQLLIYRSPTFRSREAHFPTLRSRCDFRTCFPGFTANSLHAGGWMVEKAGTCNEVAKPAVFLSPLPAPSPRSICRPSTRPRPSRANPRWWPHYEFRLFRPSNRLRAGYTANDTGNNHLQEISVKLCIISVNVVRRKSF